MLLQEPRQIAFYFKIVGNSNSIPVTIGRRQDWANIPACQEASVKLKVMSDEFLWPRGHTLTDTHLGRGCAALLSVPIPTRFVTFLDFPLSCYLVQLLESSCWGCLSAATLPSFPALLLHNLCPSRDIINPINFELWPSLGKKTGLPSH